MRHEAYLASEFNVLDYYTRFLPSLRVQSSTQSGEIREEFFTQLPNKAIETKHQCQSPESPHCKIQLINSLRDLLCVGKEGVSITLNV